jgi:hypothetical protein
MNRFNVRPHGLGIIITQLSFLLALRKKVVAVVQNTDNIMHDLKRIFAIGDDRLTIESGRPGYPDLETDELCTYVPYWHSDTVLLFGQEHNTAPKKKPCVALAMHHNGGLSDASGLQGMPYNKFATAEEYNQLFQQLTANGYDVITMNQSAMNLEHKIYLLNQLCDFVVGYEGGLGHLAHLLRIPYFCLPWRLNDMGHAGVQPGLWYETHRFHADRRTWFLQSADEFLSWNREKLAQMVNQLYNDQGNNVLFEPGTTLDPDTLKITAADGRDLTPRIMWCETRGKHTTAFIKEHLPIAHMQKYPLKSMTYNA